MLRPPLLRIPIIACTTAFLTSVVGTAADFPVVAGVPLLLKSLLMLAL